MAKNSENTAEKLEKNIILIDWFSFTTIIDSVSGVLSILGLDSPEIKWLELSGFYGYTKRIYFAGISICSDPIVSDKAECRIDSSSVLVEMSGSGCRAFETYSSHKDWFLLFSLILGDPDSYHLTRFDVAYDDWEGLLDIQLMKKECDHENIISCFRKCPIEYDAFNKNDLTIYFGSKKSDVLFRCYNKAAERGRSDVDHWIRFEMQLRRDYAMKFLSEYHNSGDLGGTFKSVLSHYMRFVVPSKSDTNKGRWKTRRWWSQFISDSGDISLFTQKTVDYNLYHLKRYVFDMAGNAIDTYIKIFGVDDFQFSLKKRKSKLSKKYLKLLNDYSVEIDCQAVNDVLENASSIQEALAELEGGECVV